MNKNKLLNAYTDLMEHLYEIMDDTLHSFAEALEIGKGKLEQAGGLTVEELDKVVGFVKRDVEHAAQHIPSGQGRGSLAEWFKFDVELLENFALDAFLSLADKTRIELARLQQQAIKHVYHSGDITLPGTFACEACGKEIAFKQPSEIPECPVCGGKTFVRLGG